MNRSWFSLAVVPLPQSKVNSEALIVNRLDFADPQLVAFGRGRDLRVNDSNMREQAIISMRSVGARRAGMEFILSAFVIHVAIEGLSELVCARASLARKHFSAVTICIRRRRRIIEEVSVQR